MSCFHNFVVLGVEILLSACKAKPFPDKNKTFTKKNRIFVENYNFHSDHFLRHYSLILAQVVLQSATSLYKYTHRWRRGDSSRERKKSGWL